MTTGRSIASAAWTHEAAADVIVSGQPQPLPGHQSRNGTGLARGKRYAAHRLGVAVAASKADRLPDAERSVAQDQEDCPRGVSQTELQEEVQDLRLARRAVQRARGLGCRGE